MMLLSNQIFEFHHDIKLRFTCSILSSVTCTHAAHNCRQQQIPGLVDSTTTRCSEHLVVVESSLVN